MNCKVCGNTSANSEGISFFRFPRDQERCKIWAECCSLINLYTKYGPDKFYKSFRICSAHFDSSEMVFDGRKLKLYQSATPKYFLKRTKKKSKQKVAMSKNFGPDEIIKLPENLCRLCAEANANLTHIYGCRGKVLNLENKLKYVPIVVNKDDILPLGICLPCVKKVEQFFDFAVNCIKAETKLKIMLNAEICKTTFHIMDCTQECELLPKSRETEITENETQNTENETQSIENEKHSIQNETQSFQNEIESIQNETQSLQNEIESIQNEIQSTENEPQNTDDINCWQLPPVIPEPSPANITNSNEIIPPNSQEPFVTISIEENNQIPENILNPLLDFIELNQNLLTFNSLGDIGDSGINLNTISNLENFFSNLPLNDPFTSETDGSILPTENINQSCEDFSTYSCDMCLKNFESIEMLNSHFIHHSIQSNDNADFIFKESEKDELQRKSKETKEFFCFVSSISVQKDVCNSKWRHNSRMHEPISINLNLHINYKQKKKHCPGVNLPTEYNLDESITNFEKCDSLEVGLSNAPSQKGKKSTFSKRSRPRKTKPNCRFCDKNFANHEDCKEHEKIHQGKTPYECLKCGKKFRSRPSLRQHRYVHMDKRLYLCPDCGLTFKRNETLRIHSRIHTGERPYICKICGFAFKQRGDCKKHEKNHDQPNDIYYSEKPEKELYEPELFNAKESLLDNSETIQEVLCNDKNTCLPTCVAVVNEFTPMDALEQIVATRMVSHEI